ncbi:TRAP transporter large permease subunit [Stappia sp. F7233]|uniref:TRAP transporter large permease subunit n=1 Tax=Stappia albiluteola TaxID=2758565 RepID=A0A839ADZ6_9HYPH|nr:TRAP transporter large permease subunit [Stappia albiluteola]MBA5777356.1 TRAP transporter large permease subunit [Stappia albiluteola]
MSAYLDLLMIAAACLCLLAGFPVAFTLAGCALVFAALGAWSGVFLSLGAIPSRIYGIMTNPALLAVPLFVFMGVLLERSRVAEDLLEALGRLAGRLPGGLGLAVTLVGALLAASTGIVGATVATMGLIALPTMLRNGYDTRLACGSIAAAGTLGQIIPPSIVLIVLGDQISVAYQAAQLKAGNFSPDAVTVADLFAGALLPGLLLAASYAAYQLARSLISPQLAPPLPAANGGQSPVAEISKAVLPALLLIVAVLGSILAGLATPTEAAAVGAIGALLLAAGKVVANRRWSVVALLAALAVIVLASTFDLRIARDNVTVGEGVAMGAAVVLTILFGIAVLKAVAGLHSADVLAPALRKATEVTAMIFTIVIGATIFSLVFRDLGGEERIAGLLSAIPGGAPGAVFAVMVVMFALGFFLDFLEIVFVVVPIVAPVLLNIPMPDGGTLSPVWLGVLMAVNLQTSFLTPPFGFALFYLRGVAPDSVRTVDIYAGVVPFVALQLMMLAVLWAFPALATWLPHVLYG